jgi:hypothetical protein
MSDLFIGVQTVDLPTISTTGITGASINTAGLEGYFERGVTDGLYQITRNETLFNKLGNYKSGYYGTYVAKSFLDNLQGANGVLYVQRLKRTGAVAASRAVLDTLTGAFATFTAGQLGKDDVGTWGNQIGITIYESSRNSTTATVAIVALDTVITVSSTGVFEMHDWVRIGTVGNYVYRKITAIDQINQTITLDAAVGTTYVINSPVAVYDFSISVYSKDASTGMISTLETWANLNIEPLSLYYFAGTNSMIAINSAFDGKGSNYIKVTDSVTANPRVIGNYPATTTNTTANILYLTGGVEGTDLTESQIDAQRLYWTTAKPMYLANAEHFTETMWDNGETYCYNGGKGEITWVGSPAYGNVFAQNLVWANKRKKSRKIASLTNETWVKVADPLNPLSADPTKIIPNVGAMMGYWIYVTDLRGIHKVPAGRFETLTGIVSIVNERTTRDELKQLADAGLNCISNIDGVMTVRSARTLSKLPEWRFANALAMQTFFKRTYEAAFETLENEMSSTDLFQKVRSQMVDFSRLMYEGSTNGGTESAFASWIKNGGSPSGFDDVVKVVVDETINTKERINQGELRANFYFMPPTPAERILIGVGLIYTIS